MEIAATFPVPHSVKTQKLSLVDMPQSSIKPLSCSWVPYSNSYLQQRDGSKIKLPSLKYWM